MFLNLKLKKFLNIKVVIRGDNCDERGGFFCLLDYEIMNSFDVMVII